MPIPSRKDGEERQQFISRCMSDDKMKEEYKDSGQRIAVCLTKACEGLDDLATADMSYNFETFGHTEEINEDNFYVPSEEEYDEVEGEDLEDWDISIAKPGLWENIRKKKEREGKNYRPAKTEKEGRPTQEQLKRAQSEYEAYADHAEADKPGKDDPRRTPAPKKDQKRGSDKNKPDSAKNPSGKITFSKECRCRSPIVLMLPPPKRHQMPTIIRSLCTQLMEYISNCIRRGLYYNLSSTHCRYYLSQYFFLVRVESELAQMRTVKRK